MSLPTYRLYHDSPIDLQVVKIAIEHNDIECIHTIILLLLDEERVTKLSKVQNLLEFSVRDYIGLNLGPRRVSINSPFLLNLGHFGFPNDNLERIGGEQQQGTDGPLKTQISPILLDLIFIVRNNSLHTQQDYLLALARSPVQRKLCELNDRYLRQAILSQHPPPNDLHSSAPPSQHQQVDYHHLQLYYSNLTKSSSFIRDEVTYSLFGDKAYLGAIKQQEQIQKDNHTQHPLVHDPRELSPQLIDAYLYAEFISQLLLPQFYNPHPLPQVDLVLNNNINHNIPQLQTILSHQPTKPPSQLQSMIGYNANTRTPLKHYYPDQIHLWLVPSITTFHETITASSLPIPILTPIENNNGKRTTPATIPHNISQNNHHNHINKEITSPPSPPHLTSSHLGTHFTSYQSYYDYLIHVLGGILHCAMITSDFRLLFGLFNSFFNLPDLGFAQTHLMTSIPIEYNPTMGFAETHINSNASYKTFIKFNYNLRSTWYKDRLFDCLHQNSISHGFMLTVPHICDYILPSNIDTLGGDRYDEPTDSWGNLGTSYRSINVNNNPHQTNNQHNIPIECHDEYRSHPSPPHDEWQLILPVFSHAQYLTKSTYLGEPHLGFEGSVTPPHLPSLDLQGHTADYYNRQIFLSGLGLDTDIQTNTNTTTTQTPKPGLQFVQEVTNNSHFEPLNTKVTSSITPLMKFLSLNNTLPVLFCHRIATQQQLYQLHHMSPKLDSQSQPTNDNRHQHHKMCPHYTRVNSAETQQGYTNDPDMVDDSVDDYMRRRDDEISKKQNEVVQKDVPSSIQRQESQTLRLRKLDLINKRFDDAEKILGGSYSRTTPRDTNQVDDVTKKGMNQAEYHLTLLSSPLFGLSPKFPNMHFPPTSPSNPSLLSHRCTCDKILWAHGELMECLRQIEECIFIYLQHFPLQYQSSVNQHCLYGLASMIPDYLECEANELEKKCYQRDYTPLLTLLKHLKIDQETFHSFGMTISPLPPKLPSQVSIQSNIQDGSSGFGLLGQGYLYFYQLIQNFFLFDFFLPILHCSSFQSLSQLIGTTNPLLGLIEIYPTPRGLIDSHLLLPHHDQTIITPSTSSTSLLPRNQLGLLIYLTRMGINIFGNDRHRILTPKNSLGEVERINKTESEIKGKQPSPKPKLNKANLNTKTPLRHHDGLSDDQSGQKFHQGDTLGKDAFEVHAKKRLTKFFYQAITMKKRLAQHHLSQLGLPVTSKSIESRHAPKDNGMINNNSNFDVQNANQNDENEVDIDIFTFFNHVAKLMGSNHTPWDVILSNTTSYHPIIQHQLVKYILNLSENGSSSTNPTRTDNPGQKPPVTVTAPIEPSLFTNQSSSPQIHLSLNDWLDLLLNQLSSLQIPQWSIFYSLYHTLVPPTDIHTYLQNHIVQSRSNEYSTPIPGKHISTESNPLWVDSILSRLSILLDTHVQYYGTSEPLLDIDLNDMAPLNSSYPNYIFSRFDIKGGNRSPAHRFFHQELSAMTSHPDLSNSRPQTISIILSSSPTQEQNSVSVTVARSTPSHSLSHKLSFDRIKLIYRALLYLLFPPHIIKQYLTSYVNQKFWDLCIKLGDMTLYQYFLLNSIPFSPHTIELLLHRPYQYRMGYWKINEMIGVLFDQTKIEKLKDKFFQKKFNHKKLSFLEKNPTLAQRWIDCRHLPHCEKANHQYNSGTDDKEKYDGKNRSWNEEEFDQYLIQAIIKDDPFQSIPLTSLPYNLALFPQLFVDRIDVIDHFIDCEQANVRLEGLRLMLLHGLDLVITHPKILKSPSVEYSPRELPHYTESLLKSAVLTSTYQIFHLLFLFGFIPSPQQYLKVYISGVSWPMISQLLDSNHFDDFFTSLPLYSTLSQNDPSGLQDIMMETFSTGVMGLKACVGNLLIVNNGNHDNNGDDDDDDEGKRLQRSGQDQPHNIITQNPSFKSPQMFMGELVNVNGIIPRANAIRFIITMLDFEPDYDIIELNSRNTTSSLQYDPVSYGDSIGYREFSEYLLTLISTYYFAQIDSQYVLSLYDTVLESGIDPHTSLVSYIYHDLYVKLTLREEQKLKRSNWEEKISLFNDKFQKMILKLNLPQSSTYPLFYHLLTYPSIRTVDIVSLNVIHQDVTPLLHPLYFKPHQHRKERQFSTSPHIPASQQIDSDGMEVSLDQYDKDRIDYTMMIPKYLYRPELFALLIEQSDSSPYHSTFQLISHLLNERLLRLYLALVSLSGDDPKQPENISKLRPKGRDNGNDQRLNLLKANLTPLPQDHIGLTSFLQAIQFQRIDLVEAILGLGDPMGVQLSTPNLSLLTTLNPKGALYDQIITLAMEQIIPAIKLKNNHNQAFIQNKICSSRPNNDDGDGNGDDLSSLSFSNTKSPSLALPPSSISILNHIPLHSYTSLSSSIQQATFKDIFGRTALMHMVTNLTQTVQQYEKTQEELQFSLNYYRALLHSTQGEKLSSQCPPQNREGMTPPISPPTSTTITTTTTITTPIVPPKLDHKQAKMLYPLDIINQYVPDNYHLKNIYAISLMNLMNTVQYGVGVNRNHGDDQKKTSLPLFAPQFLTLSSLVPTAPYHWLTRYMTMINLTQAPNSIPSSLLLIEQRHKYERVSFMNDHHEMGQTKRETNRGNTIHVDRCDNDHDTLLLNFPTNDNNDLLFIFLSYIRRLFHDSARLPQGCDLSTTIDQDHGVNNSGEAKEIIEADLTPFNAILSYCNHPYTPDEMPDQSILYHYMPSLIEINGSPLDNDLRQPELEAEGRRNCKPSSQCNIM